MTPDQLLFLMRTMADATGYAAGSLGRWASGSGDFTPRLERGHDITTRRAARVAQWLSDHWPADLEWPSDIPRPEPNPDREKAA